MHTHSTLQTECMVYSRHAYMFVRLLVCIHMGMRRVLHAFVVTKMLHACVLRRTRTYSSIHIRMCLQTCCYLFKCIPKCHFPKVSSRINWICVTTELSRGLAVSPDCIPVCVFAVNKQVYRYTSGLIARPIYVFALDKQIQRDSSAAYTQDSEYCSEYCTASIVEALYHTVHSMHTHSTPSIHDTAYTYHTGYCIQGLLVEMCTLIPILV